MTNGRVILEDYDDEHDDDDDRRIPTYIPTYHTSLPDITLLQKTNDVIGRHWFVLQN